MRSTPPGLRTTTRRVLIALTALVVVGIASVGVAADGPIYTSTFSDLAVGGYDPVAYFTEKAPVEGRRDYEFEYQGAVWRFASAKNLESFRAQPEKYAPQYGGHCAWAVADGKKAAGKPQFWSIVDGKLYLNYSAKVKERWEKDIPGFIAKADRNWPQVIE